jgi:hypothetical protein
MTRPGPPPGSSPDSTSDPMSEGTWRENGDPATRANTDHLSTHRAALALLIIQPITPDREETATLR